MASHMMAVPSDRKFGARKDTLVIISVITAIVLKLYISLLETNLTIIKFMTKNPSFAALQSVKSRGIYTHSTKKSDEDKITTQRKPEPVPSPRAHA